VIPPRFVIRQPVEAVSSSRSPDSSRAPADSEMAYPINPAAAGAVWALVVQAETAVDGQRTVDAYARC